MKKILVLFDIDGTILKLKDGLSRKIFSNIMLEIFDKEIQPIKLPNFTGMTDLQILWELALMTGVPYRTILKKKEIVWEKLSNIFRDFCSEEHLVLFDGVRELIISLSKNDKLALGLLTGNFRENAYMKLSAFGLENHFPFGAFGSDRRNRNMLPPLAIKRANQYYGKRIFSRRNTLIIGDSPKDIECAKSNEIKVLCVASGHHSADELSAIGADSVFNNFKDYQKVEERLFELFAIS